MTCRSRSASVSQIRVNWGSPILTATPRTSSPPSPKRARPKPSPSPAPGLSLATPPPALGLPPRTRVTAAGSSGGAISSRRGSSGAGSRLSGASGMASGVFIPPVRVRPSGTPLGDPASLLSKWIGRRKGGAKYQRASVSSKRPCRVIDPAQLRRFVGLQSSAQENAALASGYWIKAGGAWCDGTDVERPGGPATGTVDLLEAFAACRSDARTDMLDLDLGRRIRLGSRSRVSWEGEGAPPEGWSAEPPGKARQGPRPGMLQSWS